jgi:GNAT superfamily N-acetyltransferase
MSRVAHASGSEADRRHNDASRYSAAELLLGGAAMVEVRSFQRADQSAVRELIESGLGEHFGYVDTNANPDLRDIHSSYCLRGNLFFVAEVAGQLLGTTGMIIKRPAAQVVRVSVAKSHRRCGVATQLMHHCMEYARHQQISVLIAYTQPEWPDALGFYLHHGFQIYGKDNIDVHLRRSVSAT